MGRQSESSEPLGHPELLALARSIRRAVVDDDDETMHDLLCRLRSDLAQHLRSEERGIPEKRGSARLLITDGQQRVLDLLDTAMEDLDTDPANCTCLVRAVEIEVALRRQVQLEAILLRHG